MSRTHPTLIIAGGGTGGHLFPALALAEQIRKLRPDSEVVFVGTKDRLEARIVPEHGYRLETISAAGIRRRLSLSNFLVPFKVLTALFQSFFLIRRIRPDVVIGTGGYVCGPVLLSASLLGIPTVLHESNSLPGMTTRILARRATRVFLGFEEAGRHLKRKDNLRTVGTPTRDRIDSVSRAEGLASFALDPEKVTVLAFGGSLGARTLNEAILRLLDRFSRAGVQVIWQTGSQQFEAMQRRLEGFTLGWIGPFIDKMEDAYAAADIIICRAGATTLAEIMRAGKPAILIPFPFAAEDHQTFNARSLVSAGAAFMIPDREVPEKLEDVLFRLINNKAEREAMAASSRRLSKPDAGKHITEEVLSLIP